MSHGDFCVYLYKYKQGTIDREIGITCWKDSKMVYTITTDSETASSDTCQHRTKHGLIDIERPNVVKQYNSHMGGVDLADMRHMHVQTNIVGLHRWWLRVFFYLLDVGTSNAMILFMSTQKNTNNINLAWFKHQLLHHFVGHKVNENLKTIEHGQTHQLVRIDKNGDTRLRCTYCTLIMGTGHRNRTRYKCSICDVPFCSAASGVNSRDCFSVAHAHTDTLKMLQEKFEKQQNYSRNFN